MYKRFLSAALRVAEERGDKELEKILEDLLIKECIKEALSEKEVKECSRHSQS